MKIEKISDTQVKFILTQDDLTDKTSNWKILQSLMIRPRSCFRIYFPKLLTNAADIDDAPLMVEALPVALDSIMIIVTTIPKTMQSRIHRLPHYI